MFNKLKSFFSNEPKGEVKDEFTRSKLVEEILAEREEAEKESEEVTEEGSEEIVSTEPEKLEGEIVEVEEEDPFRTDDLDDFNVHLDHGYNIAVDQNDDGEITNIYWSKDEDPDGLVDLDEDERKQLFEAICSLITCQEQDGDPEEKKESMKKIMDDITDLLE